MTPEQFQRLKSLFTELKDLPPIDRDQQLNRLCADDPLVHAEVAKMLDADSDGEELLSQVNGRVQQILGPPAADSSEMIGQRVGAYEIVEIVGQGGMGVVYLGRDTRLGRNAALKAVLPSALHNPANVERLRREARVLASLSHPNLATVFGLEESHGTLFLAMELIEGKTLSQRLGRGAASIPDALSICEQIACGIETAHDAGVIHRDLKPGNVMFTVDGTVKVLDFGLARDLRDGTSRNGGDTRALTLTRQGSFFGTPAYMSPEQARSEPLDRRSDIFSFGAILFRCLAGKSPFQGETDAEMVDAITSYEPDWSLLPTALPPSVTTILKRCLAKRPTDRYRHIGDARLDLRDAIEARQWDRRAQRPPVRRRMLRFIGYAAIAGIIAAATIAFVWPGGDRSMVAQPPQRFDLALPEDTVQGDFERLQLAISPDGRTVVVACQTKTGQALWSRSHVDGQWRRIDGTQDAHRPGFTRDGRWITFYRDGHIFKRRLTGGGDPIRIASSTNWYGTSWVDNGDFIHAANWGDPIARVSENPLAPKDVSKLKSESGEVSHVNPFCVPGSQWVLYNVWFGGEECFVHAANLQTGEEHAVIGNANTPRVVATPRGDYLVFERSSIIFAAPFDRQHAVTTGDAVAIVEGVLNDSTRFASYFDVAADGTLAYFPGTSFVEESRMAYVNEDGTSTPVNDDRQSFSEPSFSADGTLIFVGLKGKVYKPLLYDLKQQTRELVLSGGDTPSLAVSPDGKTLAMTINRDGGYGIDLFSIAERRYIRRLVQPGADYQSDLTFSKDGKYIGFTMSPKQGMQRSIWVVPVDGEAKSRLMVETPSGVKQPAFSPDGRWLAYAGDTSNRPEIFMVSFPGGDVTRQITTGGGESPAWSPDGKKLYYVANRKLVSVDISLDGLAISRQAAIYDKPFGQSDPIGRNFTIAPDGRPLVIEPSERRPTVSHLHVITNWYRLLP